MAIDKFLEGEKVYLRSLVESDFSDKLMTWLNDKQVTYYLSRGSYPASALELKNEFLQLTSKKDEIVLAVCDGGSNEYIGLAGLHSVNSISRHAEFRILLGDMTSWGKGFGTEVCQLLVAYGFHILNLEKVWLGVNAANEKAYRSYIKSGFVEEGRLRKELYRNGSYHDIIRMSILREEYKGNSPKWTLGQKVEIQLGQLS